MGLSNGPASSASTASCPTNQVGAASGVSNMARYVGAAVATALAATIYGSVTANQKADGESPSDALAAGLAAASWVMAVISSLGILLGRRRDPTATFRKGTLQDAAASAAAHLHTLPTTANVTSGAAGTSGSSQEGIP